MMSGTRKGGNRLAFLWLVASLLAAAAGLAFFLILFLPDFNMYWLILAPIILAFYLAPSVYLFSIWKKRTGRVLTEPEDEEEVPDASEGREDSESGEEDIEKNAPDGI